MPQQILTCPICGGALEETSRWSETYDRDMKDILSVESDVAQRVL